jgi:hypothetical protein
MCYNCTRKGESKRGSLSARLQPNGNIADLSRFIQFMKNHLKNVFETVLGALAIIAALIFAYGFLKTIVAPLAPIVTIAFVLFFTALACQKRTNAILSVGGIILYSASWLAVSTYGMIPAILIWGFGVSIWFVAAFRATADKLRSVQL